MNPIKKIKLSVRVILSFGATGLALILFTLLFSGRLDRNSASLNAELAQYENTSRTYRELCSLSLEMETTARAELSGSVPSSNYLSLSKEFGQKLSSAKSEATADQLSALDEISNLWQIIELARTQEKPFTGKNTQQTLDSIASQWSIVQSKLASSIAFQDDNFFRNYSERIKNVASIKTDLWYAAYFLVFIFAAAGLFWYRTLISPLRLLTEASRRISDDKWGTRVELDSKDEFGELGAAFNQMSANTARLAAFLDAVGNPVYSIDRQFTLRFANVASIEFAGVRREDIILKKKCYQVFRLPLCQTPDCPVSKAWQQKRMVSGETLASPQSLQVPILYQAAAVSDVDGQLSRGVEVLNDITQLKKVSAEIETERKYLSENINLLLEKMNDFADGDLTIDLNVDSSDDIGKLYAGFKKSIKNIKTMIEELIDAVESTASASAQISSSIEELAAGVSEQSSQATDVAASVEQMTKTVADNAQNAARVEKSARENGAVAQSGGEIVQRTVLKMKEIAEVVKKSSETVNQLGELSKGISEIVSVIDDIADQTNLLALNAAIEAARAGEEGRGFAVVADEVRKLAERTTQATKQISSMIKNVQTSTGEAVLAMRNGIQEVNAGLVLADEAGSSLKDIVNNAHGIVDMISQIAAANEEQSATSGEISKNVELISTVSSQSANGITQIAGAADDLNRLTNNLQTLIARFKLAREKNIEGSDHLSKKTYLNAQARQDHNSFKSSPTSGNGKSSKGTK